ncbi:UNVERIFIED_CONTAM: hypothetical protein Slati_2661500 [Sesamum latifolium]|uniref:Uncharacterized protein n=1 Tax=Sesamum latifolium TaxID=2727402 RepID=A0AAW2VUQ1_9LAMI
MEPPTATLAQAASLPRVVGPMADPPRRSTSSDTSAEEIYPALLGAIQQIVSTAVREQVLPALAPVRIATPFGCGSSRRGTWRSCPCPALRPSGGQTSTHRFLKNFLPTGSPV